MRASTDENKDQEVKPRAKNQTEQGDSRGNIKTRGLIAGPKQSSNSDLRTTPGKGPQKTIKPGQRTMEYGEQEGKSTGP